MNIEVDFVLISFLPAQIIATYDHLSIMLNLVKYFF
jgi:hypothetical protein